MLSSPLPNGSASPLCHFQLSEEGTWPPFSYEKGQRLPSLPHLYIKGHHEVLQQGCRLLGGTRQCPAPRAVSGRQGGSAGRFQTGHWQLSAQEVTSD